MKASKHIAALLLTAVLLLTLCACGAQPGRDYSPVIWYAGGEPLSGVFDALAADYNSTREKGSAAVTLLGFDDEAALTRALEAGAVPDLLLCPHALAFTLSERGLLKTPSVSAPDYPAWLPQRSECVGHGFYPIGFDVLLLRSDSAESETLSGLLFAAAACGEESASAYLRIDAFAPLFYQDLLTRGIEFTAEFEKGSTIPDYVNLYNQIADAVYTHGLALDAETPVPCRLAFGSRLRAEAAEGAVFSLLPAEARMAEAHGVAVLSREPRLQRDVQRFLRWLLQPDRLAAAALEAGLVPAVSAEAAADGPLEALLLGQAGQEFHLPEARSQYYVNQSSFESALSEALLLLR